jgi:hypothetical protein
MPLSAGERIGHSKSYTCLAKVLPAALAQDPERLARFEREEKVLASLNHPTRGPIEAAAA